MYTYTQKASLLKRVLRVIGSNKWITLVFGLGLYQFGGGGYIFAKAITAQWLIADAWETTLATGQSRAPWAWADTWPVAKLTVREKTLYVLSGASGRVLAFGPGHMPQTPLPGQPGNVAIAGHRDTHFRVLKEVMVGDQLTLQSQLGSHSYRVTETRIVHQDQMQVIESDDLDRLTLITCYPFNGVDPEPDLRFVVRAVRV